MYHDDLIYVIFLVHTQTKKNVDDLGFDPMVFIMFFSDRAIGYILLKIPP